MDKRSLALTRFSPDLHMRLMCWLRRVTHEAHSLIRCEDVGKNFGGISSPDPCIQAVWKVLEDDFLQSLSDDLLNQHGQVCHAGSVSSMAQRAEWEMS